MTKINSYNELIVWQKAMELVTEVYKLTSTFPAQEKYSLASQMNRSGVSIPCNIAEGWGRESTKVYTVFLKISRGSLYELETLILIAQRLEFINEDQRLTLVSKTIELKRMLNVMLKGLKNKSLNK